VGHETAGHESSRLAKTSGRSRREMRKRRKSIGTTDLFSLSRNQRRKRQCSRCDLRDRNPSSHKTHSQGRERKRAGRSGGSYNVSKSKRGIPPKNKGNFQWRWEGERREGRLKALGHKDIDKSCEQAEAWMEVGGPDSFQIRER